METYQGSLMKERVRLLNQSWGKFQEQLSPNAGLASRINEHPGLGTLSVLTGRRELWELAVSAAGYISEHEAETEELTIKDIVQSVADQSWGSSFPGLENYITEVATLDLGSIVAAAPVAIRGVKFDDITTQMISCAAGCLQLYENDLEKLRDCLGGCL
jgi:hypothetical protein